MEKKQSALRIDAANLELFDMKNRLSPANSPSGDEKRGMGTSYAYNEVDISDFPIKETFKVTSKNGLVKEGDVGLVLKQFREQRSHELGVVVSERNDMLVAMALGENDDGSVSAKLDVVANTEVGDKQQLPADPFLGVVMNTSNEFFKDYEGLERVQKSLSSKNLVNNELTDDATNNNALITPTLSNDITPPSSLVINEGEDQSMGKSFYQFVRSPKRSEPALNSPEITNEESPEKVNLVHNYTSDHFVKNHDSPVLNTDSIMSEISSQGSENWEEINDPNSGTSDESKGNLISTLEHLDKKLPFYQYQYDDNGDIVSLESLQHTEPAVDRVAMENTLKNQAMLSESSQHLLQLGGNFGSWALGGSIESMPTHPIKQGDWMNQDWGEIERGNLQNLASEEEWESSQLVTNMINDIEQQHDHDITIINGVNERSVTFAGANMVLEFNHNDSIEEGVGKNPFIVDTTENKAPFIDKLNSEGETVIKDNYGISNHSMGTHKMEVGPLQSQPTYYCQYDAEDENDVMDVAHDMNSQSVNANIESSAGKRFMVSEIPVFGLKVSTANISKNIDMESMIIPPFEREKDGPDFKNPTNMKCDEDMFKKSVELLPVQLNTYVPEIEDNNGMNIKNYAIGMEYDRIVSEGIYSSDTAEMSSNNIEHSHKNTNKSDKNKVKKSWHERTSFKGGGSNSEKNIEENIKKPKKLPSGHVAEIGDHIREMMEAVENAESFTPAREMSDFGLISTGSINKTDNPRKQNNDCSKPAKPVVDEKTRQERFSRLTTPFPEKGAPTVSAPKSSIECKNVSFRAVDEVQSGRVGDSEQGRFAPGTDLVRFVIRSCVSTQRFQQKISKNLPRPKKGGYGKSEVKLMLPKGGDSFQSVEPSIVKDILFGNRKSLVAFPQFIKQASQNDHFNPSVMYHPAMQSLDDENIARIETNSPPRHGSPKRGANAVPRDSPTNRASETNHSIHSSNFGQKLSGTGPNSPQHFLSRFHTGVTCAVIDFYMQFLGTYDINTGTYFPGLDFDPMKVKVQEATQDGNGIPAYINDWEYRDKTNSKKNSNKSSSRQATVLEIDFTKLPSNVFALVPIVIDVSPPSTIQPKTDDLGVLRDRKDSDSHGRTAPKGSTTKDGISTKHERGDIPEVLHGMKFDFSVYGRLPMEKIPETICSDIPGVASKLVNHDASFNVYRKTNQSIIDEINAEENAVTSIIEERVPGTKEENSQGKPLNSFTSSKIAKKKEQEQLLKKHLSGDTRAGIHIDLDNFDYYNGDHSHNSGLWASHSNMMYSRESNQKQSMPRRGSVVRISKDIFNGDAMMPLGLHEAFLPFVVYRRSSTDKGWAWKTLGAVTKGVQSHDMDHILNTILENLVKISVMPFHALHVEHCDNCEEHAMSTRHVPGAYKQKFVDLMNNLRYKVPQIICQANLPDMLQYPSIGPMQKIKNKRAGNMLKEPRTGAFEVILRPYCSPVSQIIYSKISTHTFPHADDLINVMSGYLHQKPVYYDKPAMIDVIIFGEDSRQPLPDVEVSVYRLDVIVKPLGSHEFANTDTVEEVIGMNLNANTNGLAFIEDNEGDYSDTDSDTHVEDDAVEEEVESMKDPSQDLNASSHSNEGSSRNAGEISTPSKSRKRIPPRYGLRTDKTFRLKHRNDPSLGKTVRLKNVPLSTIQDPVFHNIGSWGKKDVLAWLESHNASNDVLFFAEQAGVHNGAAMLKLVTEKNLKDWGCTNKRILSSILNDIGRMKCTMDDAKGGDNVGLFNHRLHHMLETKKMMMKSNENLTNKGSRMISDDSAPHQQLQSSLSELVLNSKDISSKANALATQNKFGSITKQITSQKIREKLGNNLQLELIAREKSSSIGAMACVVYSSGSYLVKVSSPFHQTRWSNILQLEGNLAEGCKVMWASKIASRLGKIRINISENVLQFVNSFGNFLNDGIIFPVTSLENLRTYYCYVPMFDNDGRSILTGEAFLPVGRYFSQVCGTIFTIRTSLYASNNMKGTNVRAHPENRTSHDIVTFDYLKNEDKVVKAHNAVYSHAAKILQQLKALARKKRLQNNSNRLGMGLKIAIILKRYLKRARQRLLPRRVIRIQTWWRCYNKKRIYRLNMKRLALLQAITRGRRVRAAQQRWHSSIIILKFSMRVMKKINYRRMMKKRNAAIAIQCMYRCKKAEEITSMQRKLRACSNTSLFRFRILLLMKILRRRKRKAEEKLDTSKERKNLELMQKEEEDNRKYLTEVTIIKQRKIIEERKLLELKMSQMKMQLKAGEIRRNRAAVKIQRMARGWDVREHLQVYVDHFHGKISSVHHHRVFKYACNKRYMSSAWDDSHEIDTPTSSTKSNSESIVEKGQSPFVAAMDKASKKFTNKLRDITSSMNGFYHRKKAEERRRTHYTKSYHNDAKITPSKGVIKRISAMHAPMANYHHESSSSEEDSFADEEEVIEEQLAEESGSDEEKGTLTAFNKGLVRIGLPKRFRVLHGRGVLISKFRKDQIVNVGKRTKDSIKGQYVKGVSAFQDKVKPVLRRGYRSIKYAGVQGVRHLKAASAKVAKIRPPSVEETKKFALSAYQNTVLASVEAPKYLMVRSGLSTSQAHDWKYMTVTQKKNNCCIKIQAALRGMQCRKDLISCVTGSIYRDKLSAIIARAEEIETHNNEIRSTKEEENNTKSQPESPSSMKFRPDFVKNLSITTQSPMNSSSSSVGARKNSTKSQIVLDRNNNPKRGDIISGAKSILKKTSAAIVSASSTANSISNSISSGMAAAANAAKNATDSYLDNTKKAQERLHRKVNGVAGLNDALLHIAGTLAHCPSLDRQWHVGLYPKGTYTPQPTFFGSLKATNISLEQSGSTNTNEKEMFVLPGSNESNSDNKVLVESGTGLVTKGDKTERYQSVPGYPLNRHTFSNLSFHSHLTDLPRYHEMEIVIFIETLGSTYIPTAGINRDKNGYPHDSLPNISQGESSAANTQSAFFAPAFFAEFPLRGGGAFPPCGGRLHLKLRPNKSVIGRLPKAKQFLALDGLGVVVSLFPVSNPPSSFLRTFRGFQRSQPCYPSNLVDAYLLEPTAVNTIAQGASICVGSFKDRLFVSTRNKGITPGVLEYDECGTCLGEVCDTGAEKIGNVTIIVAGLKHVACCSTNGIIMVLYSPSIGPTIRTGSRKNAPPSKWAKPLFLLNNESRQPITCATMHCHAGIDILFTSDKGGQISLALIDRGQVIRHYTNSAFLYPHKITGLAVNAMRLYVSLSNGYLTVIDLSSILEKGQVESGAYLDRFILAQEACFDEDAGITCIATLTPNGFLGFRDEDDEAAFIAKTDKNGKSKRIQESGPLEGHLVLVGGGDGDPSVKVLQPKTKGIRLLTALLGHSKAVTHISTDAAGRYFFTASSAEHKILVYDGLSFSILRSFDDISIGGISLGENCLIVSSFRPPFLKMWRVFDTKTVAGDEDDEYNNTIVYRDKPDAAMNTDKAGVLDWEKQDEEIKRLEHEAKSLQIATIRADDWCHERLSGVQRQGHKHMMSRPSNYNTNERQRAGVIRRWLTQYHRIESIPTSYYSQMNPKVQGHGLNPDSKMFSANDSTFKSSFDRPGSPNLAGFFSHISGSGKRTPSRHSETPRARARKEHEIQLLAERDSSFPRDGDIYENDETVGITTTSPFSQFHGRSTPKNWITPLQWTQNSKLTPSPDDTKNVQNENIERREIEVPKIERTRLIHRANNHAHFSDSDEEEGDKVQYLKPLNLSKAQRREKNKEIGKERTRLLKDAAKTKQIDRLLNMATNQLVVPARGAEEPQTSSLQDDSLRDIGMWLSKTTAQKKKQHSKQFFGAAVQELFEQSDSEEENTGGKNDASKIESMRERSKLKNNDDSSYDDDDNL